MKLEEERFKLILAGTATNLRSREILIRHVAYLAERRGEDPMLAVEAEMPDVTIVRAKDKARAILTKAEQTLSPRIVAARQTTSSVLATEKITPGKNQKSAARPKQLTTQADKTLVRFGLSFTIVVLLFWMLYRDLATAIFPTVGIVCLASLVYQPFGQLLSELIPALTAYVLKMGLVVCALIGLGFLLAQLHVIFD